MKNPQYYEKLLQSEGLSIKLPKKERPIGGIKVFERMEMSGHQVIT